MRPLLPLCLAALSLPLTALADGETGDATDTPRAEASASKWVFRGGLNLDLNQSINLGGTSSSARITFGVQGGVGYLIVPMVELDVDVNFTGYLNPLGIGWLEFIPGARARVLDHVQLHVGVPIPLYPQPGLGVLAGLAYIQPLGGHASFVVGADYTYYLTDYYRVAAPQGRLDVHAGLQTHF